MSKERVLVVEDEEDIRELIKYNLEKENYRVACVATGEMAIKRLRAEPPDLLVLDLMLPGMDGLTVCRTIRGEADIRHIPIVMLTAKGEEADIVAGLELGADDYITKPFSPRVMVARIRAVLRRRGGDAGEDPADKVVRREGIEIDNTKHQVKVKGKPVELTFTEFKLLELLVRRPGVVFTRYQIVDAVHGADYPVTDRSVDVQVVGLRKKLGACSECIETIRGVGYRFREGA